MKKNNWQLLRYYFLWLVWPFMVVLSFYGIFREWEKYHKNTCHKFFRYNFICIATVKLLQLLLSFQIIQPNTFHSNAFFISIRES